MSRDAVAAGAPGERAARGRRRLRERFADAVPGRPAGHPGGAPAVIETTALGAAYLAGLSSGVYASTDELSHLWRADGALCHAQQRPRAGVDGELGTRGAANHRRVNSSRGGATIVAPVVATLHIHEPNRRISIPPHHRLHRRRQHGQRHHWRADPPRPASQPDRSGGTLGRGARGAAQELRH